MHRFLLNKKQLYWMVV